MYMYKEVTAEYWRKYLGLPENYQVGWQFPNCWIYNKLFI